MQFNTTVQQPSHKLYIDKNNNVDFDSHSVINLTASLMRLKFATMLMLYVESYVFPFGNTRDDRILEIHFNNNAVQLNKHNKQFFNKN